MKLLGIRRVSTMVVLTVLLGLAAVPASAAKNVSVLDKVESLGALPVSDEECASLQGEGGFTGLVAGLAGAAGAGIAYIADHVVDEVSDRIFGDDGNDEQFSARELYESVAAGFLGGLVIGSFFPSP